MSLFVENRIILDLCGCTGAWSAPYKEAGYDVRLITLPDEDVRLFMRPDEFIWGILAAPPCTEFAVSGARWWAGKPQGLLLEGLSIVDACLRIVWTVNPAWWALENPVGRLVHFIGQPREIFEPCDFGDPWTKRTCLWGNYKTPVRHCVAPDEGSKMWAKYGGKSEKTKYLRSITPPGFARAFFEANP